jgi:hypothetical protein
MYNEAKGWQALTLCVLGALCHSVAESTQWMALALLSLIFWTFGVAIFLKITAEVVIRLYAEASEASKISTRAVELERASKLTDEQAKAVPAIAYQAIMGYHLTKGEEWVAYLITKDGHIPFDWTQKYLLECSSTRLRSIRSYVNGSQAQHYAQWFTAWLRDRGYVVGGEMESGKVAEWLDHATYFKVKKLFRIDPEDYLNSTSDETQPEERQAINKPAPVTGD